MDVAAGVIAMAAVSYMLGVTLLSMPSKRVRSFAWNLVYDAATTIIFLCVVMLIPLFIGLALNIIIGKPSTDIVATMNGQYDNFICWLGLGSTTPGGCVSEAANQIKDAYNMAFITLTTVAWVPMFGRAMADLWWAFISPAFTLLSSILSLFWILYFFSAFLRAAWVPIAGIGALLYGLPGRIGRGSGAGIIATVIVFYVGLPFMPLFVGSICVQSITDSNDTSCKPPTQDWGPYTAQLFTANQTAMKRFGIPLMRYFVPNVKFQAYDANGQPLGPVLITVTNGTLTWQIWTLTNGTRTYGLPSNNHFRVQDVWYLNVSLIWRNYDEQSSEYTISPLSFTTPPGESSSEPLALVNLQLPIVKFDITIPGLHTQPLQQAPGFLYLESSTPTSLRFEWNLEYMVLTVGQGFLSAQTELRIRTNRLETPWVSCTGGVCMYAESRFKIFFTDSTINDVSADNGNTVLQGAVIPRGVGQMREFIIPPSNHTGGVAPDVVFITLHAIGGSVVDYSVLDADPLKGDIFRYAKEDWMRLQVANTADLEAITAPFILKWLILPVIYLVILGAIARDIAKLLGGKGIPLPGL